jgi:hypothetical protein
LKQTIPLLIAAFAGFLLIISKFVPVISVLGDIATVHFDILAAIAFILGGGNLLFSHSEKIRRGVPGWGYSVVALVAFLTTLFFGLTKTTVQGRAGFWSGGIVQAQAGAVGVVNLDASEADGRALTVVLRKAPAGEHKVTLDGHELGAVTIDHEGRGRFRAGGPNPAPGATSLGVAEGAIAAAADGAMVRVGDFFEASLIPYHSVTGTYNQNGSAFWFIYQYMVQPLIQTTFAMLAFYVASAAFRAFRARNVESVLLLGTAFIILAGRTFLGYQVTSFLPEEGWLSFFRVENLTIWTMQVMNTAGQRAIVIGIALGIASQSLRVLLGIERSYVGGKG